LVVALNIADSSSQLAVVAQAEEPGRHATQRRLTGLHHPPQHEAAVISPSSGRSPGLRMGFAVNPDQAALPCMHHGGMLTSISAYRCGAASDLLRIPPRAPTSRFIPYAVLLREHLIRYGGIQSDALSVVNHCARV
jgi:hypothetical protein